MEKKIISNKELLFAMKEAKEHFVKVSPDKDEYFKIWVKEPTWLEAEKALNSVMKVNQKTQSFEIDLQAMYRYMGENYKEKNEPQLSTIDILRISPYVGNQIKELLPNPMTMMQEDEGKNE